MKSVFNYTSYRDYIRDFYNENKQNDPTYSFQKMADSAGFNTKSLIPHIIDGKRNLTHSAFTRLNALFKLNEKECAYFHDLIDFINAKRADKRYKCYQKLSTYRPHGRVQIIRQEKFNFYAEWYHNTIRELVTIVEFNEDYDMLAKMLNPQITPGQAKDSVKLLLKLGLIEKRGTRYYQTNNSISTGDEIKSVAIHRFHEQNLKNAVKSIDNTPGHLRDISSIICGLNPAGVKEIKKEIQLFRKKLMDTSEKQENPDSVYTINFQLFPTARPKKKNLEENSDEIT